MGGESEAGRKNFGDALLHPRRFQTSVKKLSASSWLSSSLPFYSPLESSDVRASEAGGARIQSPCIRIAHYLVKRKVIVLLKKTKTRKLSRDSNPDFSLTGLRRLRPGGFAGHSHHARRFVTSRDTVGLERG